MYCKIITEER